MKTILYSILLRLAELCNVRALAALCLFAIAMPSNGHSQDLIERVANEVNSHRYKEASFLDKGKVEDLFTISTKLEKSFNHSIPQGAIGLSFNKDTYKKLRDSKDGNIELSIPVSSSSSFTVSLLRENLLLDSYTITNSEGEQTNSSDLFIPQTYIGNVAGDETSSATLTLGKESLRLLIIDKDGNYNLARNNSSQDEYILFNDRKIKSSRSMECFSDQIEKEVHEQIASKGISETKSINTPCITIYLETDKVTYEEGFDSDLNALQEYLIGVFGEVKTLYEQEGINLKLAKIHVATSEADDWSAAGNTAREVLDLFGGIRKDDFPAKLAHFTTMRNLGGGLAWTDVLCLPHSTSQSDWDGDGVNETHHFGPYALTSFMSGVWTEVPNYSWDVTAMAHEIGHNIGSPHTHACAWGPDNLAIDNCYATEGNCSLIASPTPEQELGTIMSYCNLTGQGIDLSKGFGALPGELLRSKIANASCQFDCEPITGCTEVSFYEYNPKATIDDGTCTSFCGDGIKNGDETGIDCGGVNCPSCIEVCTENYLRFELTFDNFPTETSFHMKDALGTVIMESGNHAAYDKGDKIIYEFCLPDGKYQFNISDQYGDGICCGQGDGGYEFINYSNEVIINGGAYGDGEIQNLEFGDSTCHDKIMVEGSPSEGDFMAKEEVLTNGAVMIETNARFMAPDIEISSGFSVMAGATFEAENHGCQ